MPQMMPPQGMAQGPQPFFQQAGASQAPTQNPMMDEINKLTESFGQGADDVRLGLYQWVLEKKAEMAGPDSPEAQQLQQLREAEMRRKSGQ